MPAYPFFRSHIVEVLSPVERIGALPGRSPLVLISADRILKCSSVVTQSVSWSVSVQG
jgi:hypothetical protein